MKFADVFKKLYKDNGFTLETVQEALLTRYGLELSLSAVKSYNQGKLPRYKTIDALSDLFDVPAQVFFPQRKQIKECEVDSQNYTMLLSYNVQAGAGADGYLPDILESTKMPISNQFLNGCNTDFLHIIQVAGDSMYPTISDNDWLIVDMVSDGKVDRVFEKVNGIYLINRDGMIQIKRLEFLGNKGVDIISDNSMYETKNTISDSIELEVIGKLFKQMKDLGALTIKELH
jgi:phage repressor protein C with HTH and peptisase S24 domain